MSKKIQKKAITNNIIVPTVDTFIGELPFPGASSAWFAIKNIYGLLAEASEEDIVDFLNKTKQKIDEMETDLTDLKEVQQGLLIQMQEIIHTRNNTKKEILKKFFINGFIEAKNKHDFELEKLNYVLKIISLEDLKMIKNVNNQGRVHVNLVRDNIVNFEEKEEEKLKFLAGIGILKEEIQLNGQKVLGAENDRAEYQLSRLGQEFTKYLIES